MTRIKMKASDTLHVSSVGPDNLVEGDEFVVSEGEAKQLEAAGLAERIGEEKAEKAPDNKMEAAPANKADKAPISAVGITQPKGKAK